MFQLDSAAARTSAFSLRLDRRIRFLSFILLFVTFHALIRYRLALCLAALLGSWLRRLIVQIFILFFIIVAVFHALPNTPFSIVAISNRGFSDRLHLVRIGSWPIRVAGWTLAVTSRVFGEAMVVHPDLTVCGQTTYAFGHHLYCTRQDSCSELRFKVGPTPKQIKHSMISSG